MTIMVDASALVAIVRSEPDEASLLEKLASDDLRITSGIALWEAVRAVARGGGGDLIASLAEIERYCGAYGIRVVPIAGAEAAEAVRVQARYGKGNHPARLNMGDCFAYACARTNEARLLYKGDDFAQTDLAWLPA